MCGIGVLIGWYVFGRRFDWFLGWKSWRILGSPCRPRERLAPRICCKITTKLKELLRQKTARRISNLREVEGDSKRMQFFYKTGRGPHTEVATLVINVAYTGRWNAPAIQSTERAHVYYSYSDRTRSLWIARPFGAG